MFRRKRLPEDLRARFQTFEAVADAINRAKETLTAAVPGTRVPGRPLADAVLGFEDGLAEARAGMAAWRAPEVEAEWRACDDALSEAGRRAEHLRIDTEAPLGFEALIGAIGDLLEPLDRFETAAERFRALRS